MFDARVPLGVGLGKLGVGVGGVRVGEAALAGLAPVADVGLGSFAKTMGAGQVAGFAGMESLGLEKLGVGVGKFSVGRSALAGLAVPPVTTLDGGFGKLGVDGKLGVGLGKLGVDGKLGVGLGKLGVGVGGVRVGEAALAGLAPVAHRYYGSLSSDELLAAPQDGEVADAFGLVRPDQVQSHSFLSWLSASAPDLEQAASASHAVAVAYAAAHFIAMADHFDLSPKLTAIDGSFGLGLALFMWILHWLSSGTRR